MIQEIINYTRYLKENSPMLFEEGLELRDGVYFIFNYDDETISFQESFVYGRDKKINLDLKELAYKISKAWTIDYAKQPYYQKCFDLPQKRIHSVSPYLVAFKRTYLKGGKEYENTKNSKDKKKVKNVDIERVVKYLNKAIRETIDKDKKSILIVENFMEYLKDKFNDLVSMDSINKIKNDDYIFIMLNIDKSNFELSFSNYLKVRAFNSAKENLTTIDGKKVKEKDIIKYDEILVSYYKYSCIFWQDIGNVV